MIFHRQFKFTKSYLIKLTSVASKMHLKRTLLVAYHRKRCQRCCNQNCDRLHPSRHGCVRNRAMRRDVQQLAELDAASLVDEVTAVSRVDPSKRQGRAGSTTCACDGAMTIEVHVVRGD